MLIRRTNVFQTSLKLSTTQSKTKTFDFSKSYAKIGYINMNKKETAQRHDKTPIRREQEQDPDRQGGFLTPEVLKERQIQRNYKRDQKRAGDEKQAARELVTGWKAIDAKEAEKKAKHKIYLVFRNQQLQEQYPVISRAPATKKPE